MAEGVVTFFLQKLSDLIERKANLLCGVDEQVNSLRAELEWIRSFLKDADGKRKENERARVWVNQVRDVAYDAEDVIDEFILKVESQRGRSLGVIGSLRSSVRSTNKLKTLHEVRIQIEKIKRRVKEISENRLRYGIEALEPSSRISNNQGWSSSKQKRVAVVEEANAVGIEDDAKMLVRKLVEGETRLSVVSIVGMGGLGKTTLAKKVYNSTDVRQHFECRAWISLSQEYRVREVLDEIIKQVRLVGEGEKEKRGEMNEQELGKEVSACLNESRYLVVVDDIWSIEAWDNLESVFPDGKEGSRVMLTTRNKEIAKYADVESTPYELRLLNEENCWKLFCRKAFPKSARYTCLSPDLEHIGREIVAKCGGLPLAVVVIGGLLSRKEKLPSEWAKVLKQINQQSFEGQTQISTILALSYNDLPYYLKSCFLYFGVFPEDFEIPSRKLIHLWVAEGLVQQRGQETMEEVAEDCLEELISRSMVQASKRRYNGEIKSCRIHDLLRDLSISEAKEEKFLDVQRSVDFASPVRARRLTIHGRIDRYISLSLNRPTPHLRSLLRFIPELDVEPWGKEQWSFLFGGFRLLRVLDLASVDTTKLPDEVGEMIHLRYLGLRGFMGILPSTISNLANLQTMDIKPPYQNSQQRIPSSISKMNQLRHLYVDQMCGGSKINGLRNLQTLLKIDAGNWIENGLAELTNLRKLGIQNIALDSHKEALFESIVKLDRIEYLHLQAKDKNTLPTLMLSNHVHLYKLQLFGILEKVPDLHELPTNLTYLCLKGSRLMQDPIATLEKLPHLRYLALFDNTYMGKRMVCTSSGFPRLEELLVELLPILKQWKIEKEAMLRLRYLYVCNCKNLKTLPEGLGNMPELVELKLRHMSHEFNARILRDNDGEVR
ncbi:hypothetical protein HHK36_026051 [Tetracentron sinense]|uniref:Uncharacterized protein n=1 Tax=Tetracentron sinense TaxID=13715 RepID=A0A835D663_TETSI|nr:hypothetical protein HHK36_026051 [Tetracentron sinense]